MSQSTDTQQQRWKVITTRSGTHYINAATWQHKTSTGMIEFSNGGGSCAAAFDRDEVAAILDATAASQ